MAIVFQPRDFLDLVAPEALIKRLVTRSLTLNRAAATMLARAEILSKKTIEKIAGKVIRQYKGSVAERIDEGQSSAEAIDETLNDKALMVQRVQNSIVSEVAKEIKDQYRGERYVWLPSTAEVPDPLHQLNYGKKKRIGVGEMPGDRYGCQCGMKILVDGDELEL